MVSWNARSHGTIKIKTPVKQILFWAPRVLCILFAAFITLFALDVFNEGYGFWQTLTALVMHLIPTAIIVGILVIASRWEWVGAVLFIAMGVAYIALAWGKFSLSAYLLIAGPSFLVGLLFLLSWVHRDELHAR